MDKEKVLSRREFMIAAGAVAAGGALAACAPAAAPTEAPPAEEAPAEEATEAAPPEPSGSITFWAVEAGASEKTGNRTWGQWIQEMFSEANPNITMELGIGEWNEPNKQMAALAAGTQPDVSFTGRHLTTDFAVRGAIYNLDDAVAGATTFTWDDIWTRLQKDALTWGKKWIIPYSTDTRALFYNKQVMEDAGLDPDTPPETLEDMRSMAAKITLRDEGGRVDRIGYTPSFGNPPVHLAFYSALWCLGSATVNADMTKCTIMDKGVEAMTYLKNLMDDQGGYEEAVSFTKSLTPGEGLDAFSAGHVGLAMHTNGAYDRYIGQELEFEWDTVIGPHFEGYDEPFNYDGGGGFIFFKTGKLDLAWKLAEFMMDKDVYLEFANLFGSMPARADVGEEWAQADEGRRVFVSTANTVHWIPIFPGIMEDIGYVADMFNNVLISGGDIEEELRVVEQKTQVILDAFNSYAVPE